MLLQISFIVELENLQKPFYIMTTRKWKHGFVFQQCLRPYDWRPNGLALSCLPQRDSSVLPGGRLLLFHVCVLALRFTDAPSVSLSAWLGSAP